MAAVFSLALGHPGVAKMGEERQEMRYSVRPSKATRGPRPRGLLDVSTAGHCLLETQPVTTAAMIPSSRLSRAGQLGVGEPKQSAICRSEFICKLFQPSLSSCAPGMTGPPRLFADRAAHEVFSAVIIHNGFAYHA